MRKAGSQERGHEEEAKQRKVDWFTGCSGVNVNQSVPAVHHGSERAGCSWRSAWTQADACAARREPRTPEIMKCRLDRLA
jgi:hypothetical protein